MGGVMRSLVVVATLAVFVSGCASSEKHDLAPLVEASDIRQACEAFKAKLDATAIPAEGEGKPTILVQVQNRTPHSLDVKPIEEELSKVILDSGKLAVLTKVSSTPHDYLLDGSLSVVEGATRAERARLVIYDLVVTKKGRVVVSSRSQFKKVNP